MHEIYEDLRESKNESKLISLIRSGKISVKDVDKQMTTPLMFAVSHNFSQATIKELIDLGSDVNAADGDGMTCLHHSVIVNEEDPSTFQLLLSKGADPEVQDADGESAKSMALEYKAYKDAFEIVDGQTLAISMTKSQYEKQ